MQVMNDETAAPSRRFRAAMALLPLVHGRRPPLPDPEPDLPDLPHHDAGE
jgi:hypothetical protein